MVTETSRPVVEVARDVGINESTLSNWVSIYRREHLVCEELKISDRARLKELKKEEPGTPFRARVPEKSCCLFRQGTVKEKFVFITLEEAEPNSPHPVIKMCTWLHVSTSGFYDFLNAVETAQQARRAKVAIHVQAAHQTGRGAYVSAGSTPSWPVRSTRTWRRAR